MIWKSACLIVALLIATGTALGSIAGVEWETRQDLRVDQPPLDVAVTPDGKHLFVLTEKGILVYSEDGKLEDRIEVGYAVDRIKLGPRGRRLYITSKKNKTVQVLTIAFVYKIDLAGSPYKGPGGAPAVITVFSDFQ